MLNRREMTIGALHTNAVSMRRAVSPGAQALAHRMFSS